MSKTAGGVTTNFLVDTNNLTGYAQVVEEIQGGSVVKAYTYGHDLISQRVVGGGVSFYGYDGQGSVRTLTDDAGSVTDTYAYDAFGNLIERSGTTQNSYLYTGEQFDADLGFYYNRARYMNTDTGRFQTQDSFEGSKADPSSLHKYLYGRNDPVDLSDPSGMMFSMAEACAVTGTIAILATMSLNMLTFLTAAGNAEIANFSLDGLLLSGRLDIGGYGGEVGGGLDALWDFKSNQLYFSLAYEYGLVPITVFRTQRGSTSGSVMFGPVFGMDKPADLSGRGVGAAQPLLLFQLQASVMSGADPRGKALSLLMHLSKR